MKNIIVATRPTIETLYQNWEKSSTLFVEKVDCKNQDNHPPRTGHPPNMIIPKPVCAECIKSFSEILYT